MPAKPWLYPQLYMESVSPIVHWIAARQTGKGGKARLIHKPGDLPARRPSVGRVSHTEADFRIGDNLVAVCGDCRARQYEKTRQSNSLQFFKSPALLAIYWMD